MSAVETRTFRAENLEDVLGTVRDELGPDAIVVRQREGIVGGIGGFFGKRCVEVDVECPPELPDRPRLSALPPRAVSNAYATAPELEPYVFDELDADDGGDLFQTLLGDSSVFASTLAEAIGEPEAEVPALPEEPEFEAVELVSPESTVLVRTPASAPAPATAPASGTSPAAMMIALEQAGLELKLAQSVVSEADQQLRIFDQAEPFENQVRQVLAGRIPTRRLTGRFRTRVIALVGAPGSGKTSAAARMCEAHMAAGRRVVAISLEPLRKTLELARQTEDIDVELISADAPELIELARTRIVDAQIVIVDTFGIEPTDEAGWTRLGALLEPLEANETHLVVPASIDSAAIDAQLGAAAGKLQIDRLVLTHLDGAARPGPAVSVSLRAGIPISATATATRLVPADPHRLAELIVR